MFVHCFASLFCFLRLLLEELLSAVHGQNQMTSCLFLPWTAQNTVFCWVIDIDIKKKLRNQAIP